jgi:hypothetical protein
MVNYFVGGGKSPKPTALALDDVCASTEGTAILSPRLQHSVLYDVALARTMLAFTFGHGEYRTGLRKTA